MPRLGEVLLAEKILTERELNSALENHVLHGVKLGTCLVEMGYVTDDDLARCLGKQTARNFLTKDQLIAAGAQNLSILSPTAVKKYRIIPVGIHGAALLLATDNDLSAKKQAELEKFLGRVIEPVVVSGYALDCFLEQMFGIPRPGRFLPKFSRSTGPVTQSPVAETAVAEATSVIINGVEWKDLGDVTQGAESIEAYNEIFNGVPDQNNCPLTLSDAAERLSRATSRDDVARVVLNFISNATVTAALLMIKDGVARGWKAALNKKDITGFEEFSAQLETLPDIQQCISLKKPYFGHSTTPETQFLWHTLRSTGEVTACYPIFIQQKVVAVLLCNGSEQLNPIETAGLCQKASYALEILILRSKLLSS